MKLEITRREFLKWSLVTGAAVGLVGCGVPPSQPLISQLDMPEYRLPGEARWFATTCQECSAGCGVSVRIIDGRAKKIEGLPTHPVNHGKVCAIGHSALQALYNPDRLTASLKRQGDNLSPVSDQGELTKALAQQLGNSHGHMLWIVPSLYGTHGTLLVSLAQKAGAKILALDFPGTKAERTMMKGLTGKAQLPYYDIQNADYIVNFGNDFLGTGHNATHDGWAYGEFRHGKHRITRGILVSFSPRMNMTVANSDKWIPIRPGSEGWVALGLGNLLSESKKGAWPAWAKAVSLDEVVKATGVSKEIFGRLAERLRTARSPLAIGGMEVGSYTNGVWSLSIIQSLNQLLSGKIESYEPDLLTTVDGAKISGNTQISTQEALNGLSTGSFDTVWVLETNPRYLLPAKLNFDTLFSKVKNKVTFTPYLNETALLSDWVVATQTWMEQWGDRLVEMPAMKKGASTRVYDLQQPVVSGRPGSTGLLDLLLQIADEKNTIHDTLKGHFKDEMVWETVLARGGAWEEYPLDWELYESESKHPLYPPPVLKTSGKAPEGVSPWEYLKKPALKGTKEAEFSGDGQVLIAFKSPSLSDGSIANRPWMQELADPITTTVWTHWVELPLGLAKELGVERGDVVRLSCEGGSLEGPAFPNPALHPEVVAVPVGQGHFSYGQYADRGENPLSILNPKWQEETGEIAWTSTRVKVEKTGTKARMTTLDWRVNQLAREALPQ